ncbi:DciA family protein [Brevibacterium sp. 50QC2O2]|jgi:predicted nucleic acid-binding Zn ribbon protein|uniref:DUF721 domain-containing protein n=1 Tax=Brevibacterium TaxID=1696 RepID=UPI00211C2C7C|nr:MULTISPECIES: DciA family protein [unclassified Brevibacterium]MCQ9368676.1 DciA family protein [Brevibacterium sp. 91QC2O2]MCQ9386429.1 DciA family protein [Brevibacterium sp. 68QC2CO]MCQ9389509.1 DciA family protein [Brevibacterium sp. 50QC2O2]
MTAQDEPPLAALEALDRVRRMGEGSRPGYSGSFRRTPRGIREPQYSGAGADARDPRKLADDLAVLTRDYGWRTQLDVGMLLGSWPRLVGPEVAEHCEPVKIDPPKLTVRASSTTWATQLKIMTFSLLDRLERELGHRVIDDIEILGPKQKSWSHGRRSIKGRGPRDTYG